MSVPKCEVNWSPSTFPVALQVGVVHVWQLSLCGAPGRIAQAATVLSSDEQARAAAFLNPLDRHRWILARAGLRCLLGRLTNCAPHRLAFGYEPYGKPFLPGHPLTFNLSHSGDLALVAVGVRQAVGVDIQVPFTGLDAMALATRFCSVTEQQAMATLRVVSRTAAFLRVWTRKEAFLKAIGHGLTVDLRCFDVSVGQRAQLLAIRDARWSTVDWEMYALTPAAPYTATLVVAGHHHHLQCWYWNSRHEDATG